MKKSEKKLIKEIIKFLSSHPQSSFEKTEGGISVFLWGEVYISLTESNSDTILFIVDKSKKKKREKMIFL